MASEERLAGVRDPDGCEVVLLARIGREKITRDHPELVHHVEEVMDTISELDHREPDPREARERYYRRTAGPSRWLLVVVSYEQAPGRVITALAQRKDPRRWKP